MKQEIIKEVAELVCRYYKISFDQMTDKSHLRDVVIKRQIAHYLCQSNHLGSYTLIANIIGNKNHSTINNSVKTVSNILDTKYPTHHYNDIKYLEQEVVRLLNFKKGLKNDKNYIRSKMLVAARSAARRHKFNVTIEFIC
jgi:hypothetical protein